MISPAREARRLACAVQFLTRLPAPGADGGDPEALIRSVRYFPLVGQLVGALAAAVWLAAGRLWPGTVAALLAVGVSILVTGGLHEDGLADAADGLGGGRDRASRLAIMKDSRLGAYGALALGLVTALRVACLARCAPWAGAAALVCAHGAGRAAAALVMAALPYAGDPARAKAAGAARRARWSDALAALALSLWPFLLLRPFAAAGALGLAAVGAAAVALAARRALGGVTGDVLGAAEQAAEAAVLLAAAA